MLGISHLLTLAPGFTGKEELIWVDGWSQLDLETIHLVVLDAKHPVKKLIIKDIDEQLHHPGSIASSLKSGANTGFPVDKGPFATISETALSVGDGVENHSLSRWPTCHPQGYLCTSSDFFSTGVDCLGTPLYYSRTKE